MPSEKNSSDGSPDKLASGRTAIEWIGDGRGFRADAIATIVQAKSPSAEAAQRMTVRTNHGRGGSSASQLLTKLTHHVASTVAPFRWTLAAPAHPPPGRCTGIPGEAASQCTVGSPPNHPALRESAQWRCAGCGQNQRMCRRARFGSAVPRGSPRRRRVPAGFPVPEGAGRSGAAVRRACAAARRGHPARNRRSAAFRNKRLGSHRRPRRISQPTTVLHARHPPQTEIALGFNELVHGENFGDEWRARGLHAGKELEKVQMVGAGTHRSACHAAVRGW